MRRGVVIMAQIIPCFDRFRAYNLRQLDASELRLQFTKMIRSLAFTTQGRLHSSNIEMFLMPTLLSDTNLFLWVDLEKPTPAEAKFVLEEVFHFHPLSIEDCMTVSPSPKVEEYSPKEIGRASCRERV